MNHASLYVFFSVKYINQRGKYIFPPSVYIFHGEKHINQREKYVFPSLIYVFSSSI